MTDIYTRMIDLGGHMLRLKPQVKQPTAKGWPFAVAVTAQAAAAHVAGGANIGINLASSRLIVLDAENLAATSAVTGAGFTLTVIPAKSQANYTLDSEHDKRGGSHTWLRVPEGIDAASLPTDKIGLKLAGGGVIDVLAGVRYVVAPPSRLAEAPEYSYAACQGGPLDAAVYTDNPDADLDTAPMWLFTSEIPCPPGMEPLHGCLAAQTPRERVEASARSQELTSQVDDIPWATWLDGDPRLTQTGEIDGCGCPIWHWTRSENSKSATLHENCPHGSGAHIWSGSMIAQLGLDGDHLSRLDLAAKLTGASRRATAARVGIRLGNADPLAPVLPQHFEQHAREAEAAGDAAGADRFRRIAAAMRSGSAQPDPEGTEIFSDSTVAGGGVPIPPELLDPEIREAAAADAAATAAAAQAAAEAADDAQAAAAWAAAQATAAAQAAAAARGGGNSAAAGAENTGPGAEALAQAEAAAAAAAAEAASADEAAAEALADKVEAEAAAAAAAALIDIIDSAGSRDSSRPATEDELVAIAKAIAAEDAAARAKSKAKNPAAKRKQRAKSKVNDVIRHPGVPLSEIPIPGDYEIHEFPFPAIPDGVLPVKNPRTEFAEVQPPLVNRQSYTTVEHEWIFSATPGLSQVAAAADSRGVGRWGLLGALMPRVAAHIPPTVRLVPAHGRTPSSDLPTGEGCSINIYTVLIGPPASGKSVTLSAADSLVPGVNMVPVGTGEGILKIFPSADESTDGDESDPQIGSVGTPDPGASDSVLLNSDEIDVFVAEMGRQGTKASGLYRSMWMGGDVGNTTSDRERHSMVPAHTYRFGIRLGAQPDAVAPMFEEAGRGTPQRFVWLPAQRMVSRGRTYPTRLAVAPVYWGGNSPTIANSLGGPRPPVWIQPPEAAKQDMAAELWRSATANPMSPSGAYTDTYELVDEAEAISERHALLQQLKICAIIAALDGLAQPQDVHWFAAEAVMEVRRAAINDLVELADASNKAAARRRGQEMGIVRAHAEVSSESETARCRKEASASAMLAAMRMADKKIPITVESLTTAVRLSGGADPRFIAEAIRELTHRGLLVIGADGSTFTVELDGGSRPDNVVPIRRGTPVPPATPSAPAAPPAPTIGTVS